MDEFPHPSWEVILLRPAASRPEYIDVLAPCRTKPEVWQTVWVDAALAAARADRVDHSWHGRLSRYVSDLATHRRENLLDVRLSPSRIPRRLLRPPECLDIPNRIVTGADLPLAGSSAAKPAAPRAEEQKMLSRDKIFDYRRDRRERARERFVAAAARRAAETRASSSHGASQGVFAPRAAATVRCAAAVVCFGLSCMILRCMTFDGHVLWPERARARARCRTPALLPHARPISH